MRPRPRGVPDSGSGFGAPGPDGSPRPGALGAAATRRRGVATLGGAATWSAQGVTALGYVDDLAPLFHVRKDAPPGC